jgi:hypothetical protein
MFEKTWFSVLYRESSAHNNKRLHPRMHSPDFQIMRTAMAHQDRINLRLASSRRIKDGFRNVVNIVIRVNELPTAEWRYDLYSARREVTRDGARLNPTLRLAETAKKPRFSDAPPRRRFSIMHSHILPECLVAFSDERDDSCRTAFTRLTIIQRRRLYVGGYVPGVPSWRSESSLCYPYSQIIRALVFRLLSEIWRNLRRSRLDRQKISKREDTLDQKIYHRNSAMLRMHFRKSKSSHYALHGYAFIFYRTHL